MDNQSMEGTIEALLFAMGEAISVHTFASILEISESEVKKIIQGMMEKYAAEDRGIHIVEINDAFQMCTKSVYYDALIRFTQTPKKYKLTDVALETLSIIAYKQPVTRAEIEKIRGVNSDKAINRLVEFNLVCETGRLDAPGKPILFGTTDEFLRCFGIRSSEDLPVMQHEKIEEFKLEAEEEINLGIEEDS